MRRGVAYLIAGITLRRVSQKRQRRILAVLKSSFYDSIFFPLKSFYKNYSGGGRRQRQNMAAYLKTAAKSLNALCLAENEEGNLVGHVLLVVLSFA